MRPYTHPKVPVEAKLLAEKYMEAASKHDNLKAVLLHHGKLLKKKTLKILQEDFHRTEKLCAALVKKMDPYDIYIPGYD